MKKKLQSLIFFIGWALSPFTTWNDVFINVPLSYLAANFLCAITRLPLKRLLIASYVATNILGVLLMYFSGREYVFSTKNKVKAAFSLAVNTALLSALVYFLDKSGMLAPLPVYFSKWFRHS